MLCGLETKNVSQVSLLGRGGTGIFPQRGFSSKKVNCQGGQTCGHGHINPNLSISLVQDWADDLHHVLKPQPSWQEDPPAAWLGTRAPALSASHQLCWRRRKVPTGKITQISKVFMKRTSGMYLRWIEVVGFDFYEVTPVVYLLNRLKTSFEVFSEGK